MPYKYVNEYKRGKNKKTNVRAYIQKYKKPRGRTPTSKEMIKIVSGPRSRTYWLKNRQGNFTGRADAEGNTTSITHVESGKDSTSIIQGKKYKRIYGRYTPKPNKKK